jgi:hypothetical protein
MAIRRTMTDGERRMYASFLNTFLVQGVKKREAMARAYQAVLNWRASRRWAASR